VDAERVLDFDAMKRLTVSALLLLASLLGACAGDSNSAPVLRPIDDDVFTVNTPGSIDLLAGDADGDPLTFGFALDPAPPTQTATAGGRPNILVTSPGRAVFTWTPGIADAGRADQTTYRLTISVRDNHGGKASETIALTVVNPGLGPSGIVFIDPPGAGMVVDLRQTQCVDMLPVAVRADHVPESEVELRLGEPALEGANLYPPENQKVKRLNWCPTPAQLDESLNHTVVFEARRKGLDVPVTKRFLVRFKRDAGANCPGAPPRIVHSPPGALAGPLNYEIEATVTDDVGFKSAPALAYTTEPIDLNGEVDTSGWPFTEFRAVGGDRYIATIPNLGLAAGESRVIHYVLTATDNDDPDGTACDHSTDSEVFSLTVTGGEDNGGRTYGACAPCVADAQCGGSADHCVSLRGDLFCATTCANGQCPAGQQCVEVTSVDGVTAPQCVPADQNCGQICVADGFEAAGVGNDEPAAAVVIEPGQYPALSVCDDVYDFYRLAVEPGQSVRARIDLNAARGDLDLFMQLPGDADAFAYQSAQANAATEEVFEPCAAEAGEAYIAVSAYQGARNQYDLTVEVGPGQCDRPCTDDAFDASGLGNDRLEDFTAVVSLPFDEIGLAVCALDQDFYGFEATAGQVVRLTAAFGHGAGDLDLRLYRSTGAQVAESLSYRDTELIEYQIPIDDLYIAQVYGATRSVQNSYSLRIETLDTQACQVTLQCPAGGFCLDGVCVDEACDGPADCGGAGACIGSRTGTDPRSTGGLCADACRSSFECRTEAGYACKRFEDFTTGCMPAGAGRTGDRCAQHSDCEDTDVCFDLPGGYCASGGCSPEDCPHDTICANVPDMGDVTACLRACQDNADCRAGYSCRAVAGGRACLP
jgi:hypothetical protein